MNINVYGMTDKGKVRAGNEDFFLVDDSLGVYAVADGMGGHKGGEVASHMAVDFLKDSISAALQGGGAFLGTVDNAVSREANHLASGIRLANRAILEASRSNPSWSGMGTTIAAVFLRGDGFGIAHVGDSRIYLYRNGVLKQLTDDHSLVAEQVRQGILTAEEAAVSNRKNVITRALGQWEEVQVDMQDLLISDGDRVLICSDGLTGMMPDSDIAAILKTCPDPGTACRSLVELANVNGGKDNITVVILACSIEKGIMAGLKKMFQRG